MVYVPKGYMTLAQVDALAEPLLADGWNNKFGVGSIVDLEKDGITLSFKYKYNRYGGYHERDKGRDEITREVTQVRMYFRDRTYHDVAKWTSYPKFTKKWADDTFAELSKLKAEDEADQNAEKARQAHMAVVDGRAECLSNVMGPWYRPVAPYKHCQVGEFKYDLTLTGLTEEQVVAALEALGLRPKGRALPWREGT